LGANQVGLGTCEIRVLGRVEVLRDGEPVNLGGRAERRVLALLVCARGAVVGSDQLCDALWGDSQPRTATRTLQSHVSRLRRLLAPDASIRGGDSGYALHAPPSAIDAERFERAVSDALRHGPTVRASMLRDALGEYHGRPFGDFADEPWAQAEAARLEELHLSAVEAWADACLVTGDVTRVIAPLEGFVVEQPLRERLWRQLMLALYRAGRQPDALRRAAQLRSILRDELGVHPSPETARLEQQILTDDPALAPPALTDDALGAGVPLPPFLHGGDPPFVARSRALSDLVDALRAASNGGVAIALVSGEAGIGKTRLVSELASVAYDDGAIVLGGQCDRFGGPSFRPWSEALGRLVGELPADAATKVVETFGAAVTLLPEVVTRAIAPVSRREMLSGDTDRASLFDAVAGLLRATSQLRPVVVVMDDLHWAEPSSLLLLRHLARPDDAARLLLVATYRDAPDEQHPPFADVLGDLLREPSVVTVHLTGLDAAATKEIVGRYASPRATQTIAARVHEITDGNPFFVQQIVSHVVETHRDDTDLERMRPLIGWETTLTLPHGVRSLLDRRLAPLGAETLEALTIAATVGRTFDLHVVALAASLEPATLFARLEPAFGAGLVVEAPDEPGSCMFSHALVRAALLDTVTPPRRAALHASVVTALEQRHARDRSGVYASLAQHAYEAARYGPIDKAVEYAMAAADAARWKFAFEDALGYLDGAITLLDREQDRGARRYEAAYLVACVLSEAAMTNAAVAGVADACAWARELDDPERFARAALLALPREALASADHVGEALLDEALERLPSEPSALLALTTAARLSYRVQSGARGLSLDEIEHEGRRALTMVRHAGDDDTELEVCVHLSRMRPGLPGVGTLLELTHRIGELDGRDGLRALSHFSEGFIRSGRRAELEARLAVTRAHRERGMSPLDNAWWAFIAGIVPFIDGDFTTCLSFTRAAAEESTPGSSLTIAIADRRMRVAWLQGDLDLVERFLGRNRAWERAFPQIRSFRALVTATHGEGGVALDIAHEMLSDPDALDWTGGRPRVLHDLAEVSGLTRDADVARLLRPLLLPYDGELLCSYLITVEGAAATSLGVVESVLGMDATSRFDDGVAIETALGAPLLAARTEHWRATFAEPTA
jgi:DNA-binding SARP family transcriptional activator